MADERIKQLQSDLRWIAAKPEGLKISEILSYPDQVRGLLNWMRREKEVEVDQISAYLAQSESTTEDVLRALLKKGLIEEQRRRGPKVLYKLRLRTDRSTAQRRKQITDGLWDKISD